MAALKSSRPLEPGRLRGLRIRQAFQSLLDRGSGSAGSPLCVLTPGGRSPLLGELASCAKATGHAVISRTGRDLGSDIAASMAADSWDRLRTRFVAATIVVVEHLETIGRSRQEAFRHLFDAASAGGTRFCISLATHPLAGRFEPDLAGRLSGGLLLPVGHEPGASRCEQPADSGDAVPPCRAEPAELVAADRTPSLARILSITAKHYGLRVDDLVGPCRSRTVSHARSLAMHLARTLTRQSFTAIGRACGGRDHTTALHGHRITSARLAADPAFASDAATILSVLSTRPSSRRRRRIVSVECR